MHKFKDGGPLPGGCATVSNYVVLTACLVVFLHTLFLSRTLPGRPGATPELPRAPEPVPLRNLPDVVIYRRTKKTGSSSMLEELLHATAPLRYVPLAEGGTKAKEVVRGEGLLASPRRLLVAEHNAVTRDDAPWGTALIIDTIVDGYRQVTAFCRFVVKVERCDAELAKCLRSPFALGQRFYRWAGHESEDASTYIDMPLSSAHPALSTTVLRKVFPNATLDIKRRNSAGSSCAEDSALRRVYDEHYKELESQVERLRMRFLMLSGYPTLTKSGDVSLEEMMDKAEELERKRYLRESGLNFEDYESTSEVSKEHLALKRGKPNWARTPDGKIELRNQ